MRAQQRKAGTNHEDPGPVAGAYDRIIWVCLLESTHSASGPAPFHACSFPLGFSHGFHCSGGFTFMWWLLGAALQELWYCYTLPGVSSSVHGTSAQDSLLTQCTTIFHACKICTCTRWLMLIRSGLSPWTTVVSFIHCVLLTMGKCFLDDYFQTGNSICLLGF